MKESPGAFLKRELEQRGWTQSDLALIMGRPQRFISEVIHAKRGITARTAHELAQVFGDDALVWMQRHSDYLLSKTKPPADLAGIRRRVARIERERRNHET